MGVNDPIADMLTRIRNANRLHFKYVDVILSRINQSICKVLKKSGYISGYEVKKNSAGHDLMRIYLKYPDNKRTSIRDIQMISKPGRRIYVKSERIIEWRHDG
jgi:small subunit ribosomal protein S8